MNKSDEDEMLRAIKATEKHAGCIGAMLAFAWLAAAAMAALAFLK